MKKQFLTLVASVTLVVCATAQENHLNFGAGSTDWGYPVYISYDFNVAKNLNVILGASYQTTTEDYTSFNWKNDIIGFRGGVQYYFDEMLKTNDKWDLYASGYLGYYVWNQTYEGPGDAPAYNGTGSGGAGIGIAVGSRWHFAEKWSLNLELGGSNIMSGALLGLSFTM